MFNETYELEKQAGEHVPKICSECGKFLNNKEAFGKKKVYLRNEVLTVYVCKDCFRFGIDKVNYKSLNENEPY